MGCFLFCSFSTGWIGSYGLQIIASLSLPKVRILSLLLHRRVIPYNLYFKLYKGTLLKWISWDSTYIVVVWKLLQHFQCSLPAGSCTRIALWLEVLNSHWQCSTLQHIFCSICPIQNTSTECPPDNSVILKLHWETSELDAILYSPSDIIAYLGGLLYIITFHFHLIGVKVQVRLPEAIKCQIQSYTYE